MNCRALLQVHPPLTLLNAPSPRSCAARHSKDVAYIVMDRCVGHKIDQHSNKVISETYNFEFLEDSFARWSELDSLIQGAQSRHGPLNRLKEYINPQWQYVSRYSHVWLILMNKMVFTI